MPGLATSPTIYVRCSSAGGTELSRSCAERVWASFLGPVVFWPLAPGAMAWATGCAGEAGLHAGADNSAADFAPTGARRGKQCCLVSGSLAVAHIPQCVACPLDFPVGKQRV